MDIFLEWAREIVRFVQAHDYLALYLLLLVEEAGVPLPLPGDTVVAYTGYLASKGQMIWWIILLAATFGSVTGSLPLYWLARAKGRPALLRYGKLIHLTPSREQRIEGWLQRHGGVAVFVGRLVPGLRVGTTAMAGVFQIPIWTTTAYLTLSAAVWWGFWLWLGATVGRRLAPVLELSPAHFIVGVAALAAVVGGVLYLRRLERQNGTPVE